jgi:hypothetical protein
LNRIDGAITTTDATPTTIVAIPATDPNVSFRIEVTVIARNPSTSDVKSWNQLLVVDKTAGGTPTMPVAAQSMVAPMGSLGASAWTLATAFDPSNIFVQVQGQAATPINWFASASPVAVMGD